MLPSKAFSERLRALVPLVTVVFCVSQPLLDMLIFFASKNDWSTLPTAILRFCQAGLIVGMGLILTRRKWVYALMGAAFGLYLAGHILACCRYGVIDLWLDLAEQLRILMLPSLTLGFVTLFKANDRGLQALGKGLLINLCLIVLSEILSVLTGTEPYTYTDKDRGIQGWFLWPNSQSAVISLLSPLVIVYTLRRWKGRLLPLGLVCLASFGILYLNATRLAYASLVGTGLGLGVLVWYLDRERRRQGALILFIGLAFLLLYPFSPMRETRQQMAENAGIKQSWIDEAVAQYGVPAGSDRTDDQDALRAAYRYDLQGLVDRFGLQTTAKAYDNTLQASRIFDKRFKRLTFCKLLMEQAPASSWVFGLEIGTTRQQTLLFDFYTRSWTPGVEIFEMEYDLYSVFYYCGIVGFCIVVGLVICVGLRALLTLLRHTRQRLNLEWLAFFMAYGICVIYGCFTISVVRQTNASVFFALSMAGLWTLTPNPRRNSAA